jgi:hypothetical protein
MTRYVKSDCIKHLEQLAMDEARRLHPTCPAICPRKYRDDSANSLTKCIIDFLRLSGHKAERVNNSGRYLDGSKVVTDVLDRKTKIGSGRWIQGSGVRGTADISTTIRGKSVNKEVKMKDRQREDQKRYKITVEKAGEVYWLVRSFEQFLTYYNEIA